ncbi:MAG: hypothetical protein U0Q15_09960 [Kineosporiaceae bacterium]
MHDVVVPALAMTWDPSRPPEDAPGPGALGAALLTRPLAGSGTPPPASPGSWRPR